MAALNIVRGLPRPVGGAVVAVDTPAFGPGTVTPTREGLHATWEGVRLAGLRRGMAVVDARIGLDTDAAFVPIAVDVRYASGMPVEGLASSVIREGLPAVLRGECLAAGSQAMASRPRSTLASLTLASPGLDDADVSGAVERVIERLDSDPRLRAVAERADASSPEGAPTVRETLEEMSRALRPATLGM